MKIRAEDIVRELNDEILHTLNELRAKRNFEPEKWVEAKTHAIASYFKDSGLTGAVVGVSGGIDSALVAGLLKKVKDMPCSPLKEIRLVSLPSFNDDGVTGQQEAVNRAHDLSNALGLPVYTLDMFPALKAMRTEIEKGFETSLGQWAKGQGVAVMRTHVLYQITSLLTQEGCPSLLVGTTNRDEGAYLGYVGKSGDGMVDLQVISELHKSEVYKASKCVGVPDSIIHTVPTGDMFDACPDTDVFGAPYEAVELLCLSQTLISDAEWSVIQNQWSESSRQLWLKAETNLNALHRYNAHKYKVGSPAVHLDLMENQMKDGWKRFSTLAYRPASTFSFRKAAPRVLPTGERLEWVNPSPVAEPHLSHTPAMALRIPGLISEAGIDALKQEMEKGPWDLSDHIGQWRSEHKKTDEEGSWRTTAIDPEWAEALWLRLKAVVPAYRVVDEYNRLFKDADEGSVWRAIGINPVFRFMKYKPGSLLIPHYDGPVDLHGQQLRSGMTVVMYLSEHSDGGHLRFIDDHQLDLPMSECDTSDWKSPALDTDVLMQATTLPGDTWIFDHFVPHDSSLLHSGEKLICRTEVLFERVG